MDDSTTHQVIGMYYRDWLTQVLLVVGVFWVAFPAESYAEQNGSEEGSSEPSAEAESDGTTEEGSSSSQSSTNETPSSTDTEDDGPTVDAELYGFARLDVVLLSQRMNHPQYSMWVRPADVGDNDPNLTIYGRLTRIGIDIGVSGLDEPFEVDGKIEADFQNGGSESRPAPRLRHGYARISSDGWFVLAGQTWDLLSPIYPSAHADALMWNAGNLGDRRPQLRAGITPGDESFGGRFAVSFGATGAVGTTDLDGNNRLDGFESGLPMAQGLAEFHWESWTDDPLKLGASGHYGVQDPTGEPTDGSGTPNPDVDFGGNEQFETWSAAFHASVPVTDWMTVRGEAFYGGNLADVRGGIAQSVNPNTGNDLRALGGWAELSMQPLDGYEVALGASMDDVVDADLEGANDNRVDPQPLRTRNRAAYLVQKLTLWNHLQFGLEYWLWETDFVDRPTGVAHRVNLHSSLVF